MMNLSKATYPIALLLVIQALSGCSGLFFLPDKQHYTSPEQFNLDYKDIFLQTVDNETLHGWLLHTKRKSSNGIVYYLHGNAENISTHIGNVMWLPNEGYDVFLIDYRGYGKSTGAPDIAGALADINAGYQWLIRQPEYDRQPKFILGQSLGAALTLSFSTHQAQLEQHINGVIVDAGFDSFRGIAREKLANWWLTWPFQYPLSWLIPSSFDAENKVADIAPIPLLVIHSTRDNIIPFNHGSSVYQQASNPKQFLQTNTPHTATFRVTENRAYLIEFMQKFSIKAAVEKL